MEELTEELASAEPESPPPAESVAPARSPPPHMPVWRLYWLAVATFGAYIPFWIYRFARTCPGADRERGRAVIWALGSLVPPACWALLREFHCHALLAAGEDNRTRSWRREFPATLYLVLLAVGGLSPLRHFILTPLFLLPLPFLFVQRTANRASLPGRAAVWQWIVAPIGTILVAAIVWIEGPGFVELLRPLQSAGATVAAESDAFQLTIPTGGWRRVAPGTLGDDDSDLELSGPGAATWLVAYTLPTSDTNLSMLVADRRAILFAEGEPRDFQERRYFLEGSDYVPVSVASYSISFGLADVGSYHVLTAETDDHVHELIAYTAETDKHLEDLKALVLSFAIPRTVGEDPGS